MKPYYEESGIAIYHGDCLEILPSLATVDLVMTDPPYGIDACGMTLGKGRKKFHRGDWDRVKPDLDLVRAAGRLVCIWGGNYFTDVLPPTNDWLVWHKLNDGRSFSEVEMAWTNFGKQSRHLSHHWAGELKQHPTQKPLAVIRWAVAQSGTGGVVLDPFMGSGTTLAAAKVMGLKAIGIEVEREYCDVAVERLRQDSLFAAVDAETGPRSDDWMRLLGWQDEIKEEAHKAGEKGA